MKRKKKFIHVLMLVVLITTSFTPHLQVPLFDSILPVKQVKAASNVDWIENGKNKQRQRMVSDSELKPPITFKGAYDIGWSISQVIAVGDYFYVLASVPNSNNFFSLPRGTYLYRIPVDFQFQEGLSEVEQLYDMYVKGADYVKISGSYIKSASHPTYDPRTGKFFVGVGEKIYVVDKDPFRLQYTHFDTNARLTGAPMMVGNDLFVVGTSTSNSNGGEVLLIKGLGAENVSVYRKPLSNLQNAEIASPTAITSTAFAIGVNFRDSVREGKVMGFRAIDKGFGKRPSLSNYWSSIKTTSTGVASSMIYVNGSLIAPTKYGTIYSYKGSSGSLKWTTRIKNVTLINNSPATDGSSIYVPVRRPGKLAKIRISDGHIHWVAPQGKTKSGGKVDSNVKTGYDIANDPTVWFTANGDRVVFYGDTAGQLIFLTTGGKRINIAVDKDAQSVTRSHIKGSDVKSGEYWEYQGTGLATENLLAKKHLAFGVNTTTSMGEVWFYSVGIIDDVYVKNVEGGNYTTGQNVITRIDIGSKDFSAGTRVPMIKLYVDGDLVGQRRMSLKPGEEKTIYFPWTVENPINNGKLLATINLNPSEFSETTYDNNSKYAKYSSDGDDYINLCQPNEEHNMDVVKTVTTCDSEGNCYTVNYYEYLTTVINTVYPEDIRAGYGFEFFVDTLYIDETSTYDGPDKVTSYMPNSPNFVTAKPEMDRQFVNSFGITESATWQLPKIYVENYSGNVFYNKNDGDHDINDEWVKSNGERKWYTDFKTQDGPYIFKSVASQAGKNNLTDCYTYSGVEVKGSPFDDYVRRSVLPDTPFVDDQKGFNWKGNEDVLGGLIDYYYNTSPNTSGLSTYYLTPDVINEIKESENEILSKSNTLDFFSEYDID
ncbi:dehydrogenase [Virgibacillus halodenitrificans]|uniref:dehydrogenase n=1 Tax=Virgibacillus halodenitrificans TaxID=1482 RepID=UPI000EF4CC29|nr:dehydrogenase [Virgibacillus halodenitrificans]